MNLFGSKTVVWGQLSPVPLLGCCCVGNQLRLQCRISVNGIVFPTNEHVELLTYILCWLLTFCQLFSQQSVAVIHAVSVNETLAHKTALKTLVCAVTVLNCT